jgi:hypothetical protein
MILQREPKQINTFIYELIQQYGKKQDAGTTLFLDDEYELDGKQYQLKVWLTCIKNTPMTSVFSVKVDQATDLETGHDHSPLVQKYLNMRLPINLY